MHENLQRLKEIQKMLDLYSSLKIEDDEKFLFTYNRNVRKFNNDEHNIDWFVSETKNWFSISMNGEIIETFIDDTNIKNINDSLNEIQNYFLNLSLI
jgi:hypothetical protein